MREVNEDAYRDLLSVLNDQAERVPEGWVDYIQVDPYMPAGVVVHGRDEAGRVVVTVSEEFVDAIPRAPITGTALSALAGVPVRRLRAVQD